VSLISSAISAGCRHVTDSANEDQLRLGKQKQVHSIVDKCAGVQEKLWNPSTKRAIPERFCSEVPSLWAVISSAWPLPFTFTDRQTDRRLASSIAIVCNLKMHILADLWWTPHACCGDQTWHGSTPDQVWTHLGQTMPELHRLSLHPHRQWPTLIPRCYNCLSAAIKFVQHNITTVTTNWARE